MYFSNDCSIEVPLSNNVVAVLGSSVRICEYLLFRGLQAGYLTSNKLEMIWLVDIFMTVVTSW